VAAAVALATPTGVSVPAAAAVVSAAATATVSAAATATVSTTAVVTAATAIAPTAPVLERARVTVTIRHRRIGVCRRCSTGEGTEGERNRTRCAVAGPRRGTAHVISSHGDREFSTAARRL